MTDYKGSPADQIAASLTAGGLVCSPTASGCSTVAIGADGSSLVLTPMGAGGGGGGGGGLITTYSNPGNDRMITSVNGSTINGEANFTFDGTEMTIGASTAADIHITGTMRISGTVPNSASLFLTGTGPFPAITADDPYFCLLADEDKDSAAIIGQAYMGYGGFLDRAVFGHKDSQAVPTAFAFMQKGLTGGAIEAGSVSINAPSTGYLSFAISSAHKARFSVMNLGGVAAAQLADPPAPGNNPQSGFAIGTNYFPSYPLDVSGGIRVGVFTDKMQTNVDGGGGFVPSMHYITGTILHTGSYILRGAPGGFGTAGADAGLLIVSASGPCATGIDVSGSITASCGISASFFQGDGSQLANLPGGGASAGSDTQIQYSIGGGNFGANSNLTYEYGATPNFLSLTGTLLHTGSYELSGGLKILSSSMGEYPANGCAFDQLNGGHKLPYIELLNDGFGPTNNYYTASLDYYYMVLKDNTGNPAPTGIRVALPDAASAGAGRTLVIKRGMDTANVAGCAGPALCSDLVYHPQSHNYLDLSQDDKPLNGSFESVTVMSDGNDGWWTV